MLFAKVAIAAENHTDEYPGYAMLMAESSDDLARTIGEAFGNTASSQFAELWSGQDAGFVDYTVGVVTHDQGKAQAGLLSAGTSATQIAQLFAAQLHTSSSLTEAFNQLIAPIKEFVDDGFAQSYALMYRDIDSAFTDAAGLGDLLAPQITAEFPDKFPGDVSSAAVQKRTLTNERLLERAYLETMVTDALAAGRSGEAGQALASPVLSPNSLATHIGRGDPAFVQAWSQRDTALERYASGGDESAREVLEQNFVQRLASATGAPSSATGDQVAATLKAVDDQRRKDYNGLPADDRAAATAMQPIADAISAAA